MCWTMGPGIALIILLSWQNAGVEAQEYQPVIFYPFGIAENDNLLFKNNDDSSGLLSIEIDFPFFDSVHTSLYVSINLSLSSIETNILIGALIFFNV